MPADDKRGTSSRIGFLDLEENPVAVMPLSCGQARDIWLFLGSATRFARDRDDKCIYHEELIGELWQEYAAHTDPAILPALEKFVRFMDPLRALLEKPFVWRKIGNDARQSVFVTSCILMIIRRRPLVRGK